MTEIDPKVVYCMGCGAVPGQPHYCEECQRALMNNISQLRKQERRSVWERTGLPDRLVQRVPPLEESVVEKGCRSTIFRGGQEASLACASRFISLIERGMKVAPPNLRSWHTEYRWFYVPNLVAGLSPEDTESLFPAKPQVVVLEGLGEEYTTSWRSDYLARIITARHGKVTLVTSPMTAGRLTSLYGERAGNILNEYEQRGA